MTAQHLPQSVLNSAEAAVAESGKAKELTVCNIRGVGILLLRLRPSQQGVLGSWTIRYQEGPARPTIPLGNYNKKNQHGLSLDFAQQQFEEWAAKREGGITLVKPKGRVMAQLKTREQHEPVPQGQTVRALVNIYLDEYAVKNNTLATVKTNRYMFAAHLGKLGLDKRRAKEVNAADIQAVVNEIVKEAGPAQAERFRATMRSIYNMAAKAAAGTAGVDIPVALAEFGIQGHNLSLVGQVKGSKRVRRKPMDGAALPMIYAELDPKNRGVGGRPTMPLLRATLRLSLLLGGTRFEQINRLEEKDFCFRTRQVTLVDEKGRWNKEPRVYQLPMTDSAVEAAKIMLAEKAKGYVLGLGVFGAAMKRAMKRAGINDDGRKQGRDVRSTIATWWDMEEQGVRREVNNYVQSHGQMIEDAHYIEGSKKEKEIRRAMEKLERLLVGAAEPEPERMAA